MWDSIQVTLCVAFTVRALGQVLAQQPVCVPAGTSLPWAVRIDKQDRVRESLGQLRVLSHLFPSVAGYFLYHQLQSALTSSRLTCVPSKRKTSPSVRLYVAFISHRLSEYQVGGGRLGPVTKGLVCLGAIDVLEADRLGRLVVEYLDPVPVKD